MLFSLEFLSAMIHTERNINLSLDNLAINIILSIYDQ